MAQKNASLKSGARGLQARKDLRAAEDKLQASKEVYFWLGLFRKIVLIGSS